MKYVAAYLLANIGGKDEPTTKDLEDILGSVGVEFEKENAEKLVKLLNGKNVDEVISTGLGKLASVPSGGGASAPAAPAAGAAAAAADKPAEDKKKKDEPKEESDEDMGFGLFD